MAHYAFIKDGIVTEVITGVDEDDTDTLPDGFDSWEDFYITLRPTQDSCKRTSYHTRANAHMNNGTAFRGNYASIDFIYDSDNDVFYPQQPYPSWTISEDTNWLWKAPLDEPADFDTVLYVWNEDAYQDDNTTGWELG